MVIVSLIHLLFAPDNKSAQQFFRSFPILGQIAVLHTKTTARIKSLGLRSIQQWRFKTSRGARLTLGRGVTEVPTICLTRLPLPISAPKGIAHRGSAFLAQISSVPSAGTYPIPLLGHRRRFAEAEARPRWSSLIMPLDGRSFPLWAARLLACQ